MSLSSGTYLGGHSTVSQCARAARAALAGVDRAVVLDQHDRLGLAPRLRAEEMIDLLKMGDEVTAALGGAGMHDELACEVIERHQYRDLPGLSRRWHAQVRSRFRPGAGEIGMGQRLALVAIEKDNVAAFGLLFAQVQAQADPLHLAGGRRPFSVCRGRRQRKSFFRNALDSCERLMLTPSRASISARSRGIIQLGRSATGL